ncbi:putative manganese-dependent inorganic diphosphatase [Coprothermobacter platensis]|uniref:putative manganese-dependent inorganic diphosphatase n=1 Tax=Coprothermobacter platensis TaxID=108819 RepID=UPI001FE05D59|nr:putative manganese-dependent inorganic diphosphatase [Coprothermobacter platensis]
MVYVVGHKNPDTDSIVSAVGYAALQPDEYVPFRAGEPNDETVALFSLANHDLPPVLNSLHLTAEDMAKQVSVLEEDATFLNVAKRLEKQKVVPILKDGKLQGIVTEKDIFRVIQEELFNENIILSLQPDVLQKTVPGTFLSTPGVIKGKPLILASSADTVSQRISADHIVIMGDRWDLLPLIIERKVGGLVFTMGITPPEKELHKLLDAGIIVYSSSLHTYNTVRLLFMALSAKEAMNNSPVSVSPQDGLQYLRRLSNLYRHRYFPIVEEDGSFKGLLELADLASPPRKRVVLVDHNEHGQAVDGVEEAEVVAIIDHHRVASFTTDEPIKIIVEPVGSTSTLVAREYLRSEKMPAHDVSTLLLGGIISDTLNLQSVTTTPLDVDVAQYLEDRSVVSREELAGQLFQARIQAILKDPSTLTKDFKLFTFGSVRVGIAQIEVPEGMSLVQSMRSYIDHVMEEKVHQENLDLGLFMLTDITRKGTLLFAFGDRQIAQTVWARPFKDGFEYLPQVVSRKKQIVPILQKNLGTGR